MDAAGLTTIGTFPSQAWGIITAKRTRYAEGGTAVLLFAQDGEPLGKLSTNLGAPTRALPPNCFHLKDWSENAKLAEEALESPLFRLRDDLPEIESGFVSVMACEIVGADHG